MSALTLAGVSETLTAKRAEAAAAHEVYMNMSGDESDQGYLTRYNAAVDKATRLDGEVDGLVRQASDLIVSGGGGSATAGEMRISFGNEDIRRAFNETQAKRPVTIGGGLPMGAVVDSTAMPMGGVADFRISEVFPFLREVPVVAALFPVETTDADVVSPYRGLTKASGAAPVAKGDTKPSSSPAWEKVDYQVQVIAHTTTIDNRIVSDYSAWRDLLGGEMVAGLLEELDSQVLSGSGTSPALAGITGATNSDDINTVWLDGTNSEPISEALHRGITAVRKQAYVDATTIVIHPDDLEDIRFEKADSAGTYLNGSPTDGEIRSLWGLNVVPTTAITSGEALVLNPEVAGRLYVRQPVTIDVNPWSETEFKKNELLIRCETRVAFALVRPKAACLVYLI